MKQSLLPAIFILFFSLTISGQQIVADPASSAITFRIKSWGLNVEGKLNDLLVDGLWDPINPEKAYINASVRSRTIDANIDARNKSLRSEEYFYIEKFPEIVIKSNVIQKSEGGYVFHGTLKMRNTVKAISFPFTAIKSANQITFNGSFTINRLDYGVGPSTFSLGDDVKVFIHCVTKIAN